MLLRWLLKLVCSEGNDLFKAGDFAAAVAAYSEAIALQPANVILYSNRRYAHVRMLGGARCAGRACVVAWSANGSLAVPVFSLPNSFPEALTRVLGPPTSVWACGYP